MTLFPADRRRFLQLLPLSGLAMLASCSKSPDPVLASTVPPPAKSGLTPPAPTAPAAPTTPAVSVPANDGPMLDASDATAASMGYVTVAALADSSRFPVYASGNQCSNCALYQGAAGSVAGGCPIFVGRRVAAEAWCSAWSRRG